MDNTNSLISSNTYIYSPQENKAIKLAKSHHPRYTFNLYAKGNYVYALGGRSWGDDDVALMSACERFNLTTGTWEKIGDLKQARCSAMVFDYQNVMYIAGGYAGDKLRCTSIERFNEAQNSWELIDVELRVGLEGVYEGSGLEGSCVIPADSSGNYYFIAGRTDRCDSDKIWQLNLERGSLWECGTLQDTKSLHKVFSITPTLICIFGGEAKTVEFFDLNNNTTAEDELGTKIENSINRMFYITGRIDNKLTRQSLA